MEVGNSHSASEILVFDTSYFYTPHPDWGPIEYESLPSKIVERLHLGSDLVGQFFACPLSGAPPNRYGDTARTCIEDGKNFTSIKRDEHYSEELCTIVHKLNPKAPCG